MDTMVGLRAGRHAPGSDKLAGIRVLLDHKPVSMGFFIFLIGNIPNTTDQLQRACCNAVSLQKNETNRLE
ncbi:MAG: hypothetical protein RR376_15760 [Janthinobacterium sp.]